MDRYNRLNLEELNDAREKVIARMKTTHDKYRGLNDQMIRAYDGLGRIQSDLTDAPPEEKDALLFEATEIGRRIEELEEESTNLRAEVEQVTQELTALDERTGPAIEELRTASIETEKMFFEVFKLVATLAVGAVVAISAVTPALFPRLGNLVGLWPAYGWLLVSLASSVVACAYLALSIGMTLNPLNPRSKGLLRRWLPEKLLLAIIALFYALLVVLPLSSLLIGLWQFTAFVVNGLD